MHILLEAITCFFSEAEILSAYECVNTAFPKFSDWKHVNEPDEFNQAFALWGEFVPEPSERIRRRFFITFNRCHDKWAGHLSVGQHFFFWSSADFGDAILIDTEPCPTLKGAISRLRTKFSDLFSAFSGELP